MGNEGLWQLVFRGEVLAGFEAGDVRQALAQRLRLDDASITRLFGAARTVVKRGVDAAEAERHVTTFRQLGARLHIEPMVDVTAPAPAPATRPALAPAVGLPEEEIVCPNCSERQSKRILCRSCATDMPMGIAARLEAEAAARAERLAASRAARGLAPDGRRLGATAEAPPLWGFGLSGRLGRLAGTAGGVLVLLAAYLVLVWWVQRPDSRLWPATAAWLLLAFLSVRHTVLRLHDLNITGWASLLLAVPALNIVAGLVLTLMPGTAGDNDHGEPPREGDPFLLAGAVGALCLALYHTLPGVVTAILPHLTGGPGSGWAVAGPDSHAAAEPRLSSARQMPSGARADFEAQYAPLPGFKAFATTTGAWGWAYGAPSLEQASVRALMSCEARRDPSMPACEVVDQAER